MVEPRVVEGGGGVRLHVREWGNADGPPILFVHGWSQCHMCWSRQYQDPALAREFRLVAFDLRGHGMSGKPEDAESYDDPGKWATDVDAVIRACGLEKPLLVGWSYGGFVVCDYLRVHGQGNVAGVVFAGAAVTLNRDVLGKLIGPGFLDHVRGAISGDLPTNIRAMRDFVRVCTAEPLPREEFEEALCWNMVVPPRVRYHLVNREIDSDDALAAMTVPVLMAHGRKDTVVMPATGEHILEVCSTAEASWYDGVAHAPFLEDHGRFNRELADLRRRTARG